MTTPRIGDIVRAAGRTWQVVGSERRTDGEYLRLVGRTRDVQTTALSEACVAIGEQVRMFDQPATSEVA